MLGNRFLLSAFLLLLFSASCSALAVDSPANIFVQQEQRAVLVSITNDSSFEQSYSVDFYSPVGAFVSPSSGKIAAGKTVSATLSVSPDESLVGSTYAGTLAVEMGDESAFRNVNIVFKEAAEEGGGNGEGPGNFSFAGFFSFFEGVLSLENLLDLVLIFIAAVLLIAFISRLVRRVNS